MGQELSRKTIPFPVRQGGAEGSAASEERLDSWKEIASYLRRGARTVQRWERDEGLPVHRLQHDKQGTVYAYKSELDAWWENRRGVEDIAVSSAYSAEPSIAVVPFSDMTREKDQDYFCEGIAEEITNALGRIRGVRVASRTSSFRFRAENADAREIGRQLNVRTLLEGSVRRSDGRLRISVRLTETETGFQVWTETYDRVSSDIFAIQEEIANSVAKALQLSLSPSERAALGKTPTRDERAYDCYLRGRKHYYGYGPLDMDFAIQLFTRAITFDTEFALAYAGLADCWSYIYLYSTREDIVREQADWASAKAVELDEISGQAHASRALALSLRNAPEAEAEFQNAIRLDPNLFEAYYFYARHAFARGEIQKAVQLYEKAMQVSPDDYQAPLLVAQSYETLGQPEKARAARRRGAELAERHLALNPDDVRAIYMAANSMVALGHLERGREWAKRALSMRPDDPMVLYNLGCIYSLAESSDDALDCLERAVDKGLLQRGWFANDSNLDSLRSLPRFQKLLDRLPSD